MLRPKVKEYLDVFPTGSDRYQVRGPEYLSVLKGSSVPVLRRLLPLLDGNSTTDELVELVRDVAPEGTIKALLARLETSGILEDASEDKDHGLTLEEMHQYRDQMMFFASAGQQPDGAKFQKALSDSRLFIIGEGELASRIAAACARAGVAMVAGVNLRKAPGLDGGDHGRAVRADGLNIEDLKSLERLVRTERPSLLVLALDRVEPAVLDRVSQISQDLRVPILHSRLNTTEGIVGPLVEPGKTACLMCHHLRVIRNYDFYDDYMRWEMWIREAGKGRRAGVASLGPFTDIVAGISSLEIVKKLSSFWEPELYGRFLTINALTLEVIPHIVLRIPRCPSCGNARHKANFSSWVQST
jgi:bacteriocin biosynthesis cyclodehydratase domain-containing protein